MKKHEIINRLHSFPPGHSAWDKGVYLYALELAIELPEDFDENLKSPATKATLLNGANDWTQYSEGGSSLNYDADIAERLCSPSELKRATRKDGTLKEMANSRESWLEVQARALYRAERLIRSLESKGESK